jgi:hypothetical protein
VKDFSSSNSLGSQCHLFFFSTTDGESKLSESLANTHSKVPKERRDEHDVQLRDQSPHTIFDHLTNHLGLGSGRERRRPEGEHQRNILVMSLLLLFAFCQALPAFSATNSAFPLDEDVLAEPLRETSSWMSSAGLAQLPHMAEAFVPGLLP